MKLTKNLQSIARDVLLAEADAIRAAVAYLDVQFDYCVDAILTSAGRVVVTGVGKSALIGQKLVATLNSTGTPALFMHAADAIHGDLGMVQTNDVVLAISKSGNTPEVKVLVPLIRRTGAKLIALVAEPASYLAKQADFVLLAPVPHEADPLNLAPTTSTTVAMALGDALAIALLTARGFTRQDFARYHPGGSLGKKLYLKVSDLYPANQCPCVLPHQSIHDTMLTMSAGRLGATAVQTEPASSTDSAGGGESTPGTLLGIITDGDVRRMVSQHDDYRHLCARDIMTPNPICVSPDDYAVAALEIMQKRNITQILVADEGKLVGFVHLHDLLKEGLV
ncbi:KpsF/GutQ family sugar-phosphate isomerase [Fibrivirga algicola]|uniref:KpsF/GutQ family sugar-phosphate isomerase n=1 Tax=Fibrivirga algicola TaxID=2950420 RepID=A0ABX0QIH7_9BACT|nr:KpsF/GutQ family sugar-phosphate isomerase [Fibrivirga algicola]NID11633.1 KpsF/GutQ family sugar-phosphate isomerase [Fibrivirga algicola]